MDGSLFSPTPEMLDSLRESSPGARPAAIVDLALAQHGERALYVQIPADMDRSAYVVTTLARQCGRAASESVAQALEESRSPSDWLAALQRHLTDRTLVVEHPGREQKTAYGDAALPLRQPMPWESADVGARTLVITTGIERTAFPGLTPRSDGRWASDVLWHRVDRDPTRYTLAVAWTLALGTSAPPDVLRDVRSLARALWGALPEEVQELLGLLRTHGRPIARGSFEALSIVDAEVVEDALECHLLEQRRGQISLPFALAEAASLTPSSVALQHRRLAEAFERHLDSSHPQLDRTTALLESHRHFAAVPDPPKARFLARYGVGVLLSMALDQSQSGAHADAAATYAHTLDMLGSLRDQQRLRAYVVHYLHFNRSRALPPLEPLEETLAGYRAASAAWPENVLFASRLARVLFLTDHDAEAAAQVQSAWSRSVDVEASATFLLHELVKPLLARRKLVAALVVDSLAPSGIELPTAKPAWLDDLLARGWTTRRVWSLDFPVEELPIEVACSIRLREDGKWEARIGDVARAGDDALASWTSAVRAVRFLRLADLWQRETAPLSSRAAKFAHPAYREILAMGSDIVPEILRRLAEGDRGHWDEALASLEVCEKR